METKEAEKMDFTFKGEPVKVRFFEENGQAFVQLAGLDMSQRMTVGTFSSLVEFFSDLAQKAEDYESK